MRAILIDPNTQTVSEVEIDRSPDAMKEALGGYPERAANFTCGDILHVDSHGLIKAGNKYFDIGTDQSYAGRGLIIGAKPLSNASISVAEVENMVTYPDEAKLPDLRYAIFDATGATFGAMSANAPSSMNSLLDVRQKAEIFLLPSLAWVDDDGIFGLKHDDDYEDDLSPHIEMFPESGNTELIHVPARFAYNINSEGICWLVPSGMKAECLKAALRSGEPLRAALSRARLAALADAAIHAACTSVSEELNHLVAR